MTYFTMRELTRSAMAEMAGIDNTPPEWAKENLRRLVQKVLDPVRKEWGKPIYVNSGYRSEELNEAVGGAKTSQHLRGEAVDITAGDQAKNKKLFDLILYMQKNGRISFDQAIDEKDFRWIHISYSANNRNQILHLK